MAIMAPAFGLPLSDKCRSFAIFIVLGFLFFVGGLYFRHEGLKIYGFLFEKRNPDSVNTYQSRQHGQAKAARLRHAAFACRFRETLSRIGRRVFILRLPVELSDFGGLKRLSRVVTGCRLVPRADSRSRA